MITPTEYTLPLDLVRLLDVVGDKPSKTTINAPTGDFFYDAWNILPEYKGTVFEEVLDSLPFDIGEARVIVMQNGSAYLRHADIDDRYHLTIRSDSAYLVDLHDNVMFPTEVDGRWYLMDAGKPHSAVVFGEFNRVQLVVRKLLSKNNLIDPASVEIHAAGENPRYRFDNLTSIWLNEANKKGIITDFSLTKSGVTFLLEKKFISQLKKAVPPQFEIKIGDIIEH